MPATAPLPTLGYAPAATRANLGYLVPICFVATLGGLLFGYDTGVIAGAIEPLTARFRLDEVMKGWASACVLLGCAAGVVLVGPLSDRLGRKLAMFLAAVMFIVSAVGTALPRDIWTFIAFRFIGGVGIGIASISTPMYIAEITPARIRGRMVAVNQIAIAGGLAASAFVNYAIAHATGDPTSAAVQDWLTQTGWRWMFAASALPAVLFGLLLLTIPESPRWLMEMNHEDRARGILARVAGPGFADAELDSIRGSLSATAGRWSDLLSPQLLPPLLLGIALAVLQQVTGINVFLYFGPTIFKGLSASTGVDAGLLQQIIITGAGMLFTIIAILTVDRWGRRPLMLIGTAGMGISLLAMGLLAQFTHGADSVGNWMLLFILLYIACFGLSVGPVVWVILSEIYPTAVRGMAMGVATCCLWLADLAVTWTFAIMDAKESWFVRHFNHAFPFYVYAVFCAVMILIIWRLTPETKGRSLEEIEQFWKSRQTGSATSGFPLTPRAKG